MRKQFTSIKLLSPKISLTSLLVFWALFSQAQTTWTGATDTDWATPGNWSAGVPDATDDVTIPNVANDPVIGAAALAKSVTVQSSAVLTIAAAGSLTIDGSSTGGFLNQGTTENSGTLTIGATSSVGTFGIRNDGTFNNNTSGQISIDRSTLNAIANYSTFTNVGHIRIGQLVGITGNGVVNQVATAVFNHNGGKILVDRWTAVAVYNDIAGSTFNNAADITIGSAATGGNRGIFNIGTFHHTAGKITIDNTVISGMANGTAATFNNASDLTIGALASVANYGIENSGNFNNNTGGEIKIDRSSSAGINNSQGTFTNLASITIGTLGSVGTYGISNTALFNNSPCSAVINIVSNNTITNNTGGTFNNAGSIIENASGTSNITNNTGVVLNLNGGTFNIGSGNAAIAIASAGDIWTGCTSTNWSTATNWLDGSVPTAADDVIIPNTANKPVIGAGTAAVAKSVIITVAAAQLTISSTATLSINSSTGFALENYGILDNSGTIRIGNTSSVADRGIVHRNGGTLNNKTGGLIQIDRTSAVEAFYTSGVVNNEATIEIGSNATVTGIGLTIDAGTGVFNNKTGGVLQIDRTGSTAIVTSGLFNNSSILKIGSIVSTPNISSQGISNSGMFNNNPGGNININRTGTGVGGDGLYNGGTFVNAAILTIGDVVFVAQDDIYNAGTFNNTATGVISVDRASGNGIWNFSGTFQNDGKITVGSIASTGTGILSYVPFTNSAGAEIHIDRVPNGIVSTSTFTNAGLIKIGANASLTASGIDNTSSGTFHNNMGGLIQIDRTGGTQAFKTSGVVNNEATIEIGSNAAVTGNGVTIVAGTGVFNNKTGGLLTINRSTGFALENFGTLDNIGTIRIGNVSSVANRGIVHRSGGTLNNKTGGLIQIDRTSVAEAFYTSGVVNNEALIKIGSNAAVTGQGLYIEASTGVFNNKTGGLLTINQSTVHGMENKGTLDNNGTIRVGNIAAITAIGIVHRNGGTFNNKTGGLIEIDRTGGAQAFYSNGLVNNQGAIKIGSNADIIGEGIRMEGNTFNNEALIEIGSQADVKSFGIRNRSGSTFNNKVGGDIRINRIGILNTNVIGAIRNEGTFTNDAKITIGNIGLVRAQDGIYNAGSFTNNVTGIISIAKPWGNGIWNVGGTYQNAGKISINNVFNTNLGTYSTGILNSNSGSFNNQSGAEIHIDLVANGITSTNAFTNAGLIRMGENGPLTGSGIANIQGVNAVFNNNAGGDISIKQTAVDGVQNDVGSTFNNNACAKLTIFDNLNNAGAFTNAGLFTVNTTQAHTNTGTLTNNGIIEYPQGNPIPNVTNNDVIVAPIFVCGTPLTPALQIGGMNSFTIGTTWYKEPALTNAAGIYSPNTFTVTNLTAGNTYPLYFEIIDPANMCTRTVSISAAVNVPPVVSTPQTALCTGQTMTLSPTSGGTWQTSNLSMASVTNEGLVTAFVPGVVYFTFTSDATKCSANTANVTIKQTPTSNLTASKVDVCANTEVTLNPNCSIPTSTVNWNPGAPTVTPAAATLPYIYKARCEADGCTGNESSVEVRTHRILVDMKDLDVGALPLPIVRSVKDNMAPANQINAPVFPRRWTFIANGCDASESAEFKLSGPVVFNTIDNTSTYAMFANEGNSFYSIDHPNYGNGGSFPDGTYTLTINLRSKDGVGGPYPKNRVATGALLATRTLQFTVGGQQAIVGGRQSAVVGPSHGSEQWAVGGEQWAVVAPNPVFNTMRLKINEAKGQNVGVNLIDASGRIMLQRSFVPETNQHQEEFEVSQLSAGMYFLKVNTENKNATLKVVKIE